MTPLSFKRGGTASVLSPHMTAANESFIKVSPTWHHEENKNSVNFYEVYKICHFLATFFFNFTGT